jgi:heme-degrading monooxygenase HmoA
VYVRITTVNDANNIDKGIEYLRDVAVPQLREQRGFRGVHASGDRAAGIFSVLTLWDTGKDLDASESAGEKLRTESLAVFGGSKPTVERFEQTVDEVGLQRPTSNSRLQISWVKMDPALVDDNLEFFKASVLPEINSMPGFQALRQLINRTTGEGAVGIVWADHEALQASEARMEQRRDVAESRGIEFGDTVEREILFAAT